MENASKALLIAGAILIAIILIGIGVMVVSSANGIFGTASEKMDQQAIQMFNQEFENYQGSQKGSSVRSLMSAINSSNATHEQQIAVTLNGTASTTDVISTKVRATSNYTVTLARDTSGLVNSIDIAGTVSP